MTRGVRWIDGREFLLNGRTSEKEEARQQAKELRKRWTLVRVVKLSNWDFMLYCHGLK